MTENRSFRYMSKTPDPVSLSGKKTESSILFLRQNLLEWDWAFRFLRGSSKNTGVIFGSPKQVQEAPSSRSVCQRNNKRRNNLLLQALDCGVEAKKSMTVLTRKRVSTIADTST